MGVPKPTPIFLEINHYRNIYEAFRIWYSFGDFDIPKKNVLLHVSSADVIYEYYCLLNIYESLFELGYKEEKEKRKLHKYSISDPRYVNTSDDNTYYFINNQSSVVLYFQPVIYSGDSNTKNDIELFRTDGKYYTPDFVIKHIDAKNVVSYGIFDAKWRNRNVLLKQETAGGLRDTVYKYYHSIRSSTSLLPCKFLWLLEGKDDPVYIRSYTHNNGSFSRKQDDDFRYSTGIVRVTPKSGVYEMTQVLSKFLD